MITENIIAVALIALVLTAAIAYIVKAKKSGKKCIGCPDGGNCSGKGCTGNCCSCGHSDESSERKL